VRWAGFVVAALTAALAGSPAQAAPPPNVLADLANMTAAYGRVTQGQLGNPAYLPALVAESTSVSVAQLLQQVATPARLALTAGNVFPGWNVGNPLRAGWNGTRGTVTPVAFTNRYGALLRGDVFAPLPGRPDPYTGQELRGPFPGVVLTPGSVQGSARMYWWLAQDLAERGYVVLVYDVQGQGTSETLPHTTMNALPFCNLFAPPGELEMLGCPGVPFQQAANFVYGTLDATDFFFSTPEAPYENPGSAGAKVDEYNPLWESFDRSPDPSSVTSGRDRRFAIVGHSLGASAVSYVQGRDPRVSAVVALDKLSAGESPGGGVPGVGAVTPTVPALGIQSEYGFTVTPAALSGGNSLVPAPGPVLPGRERASGFDGWREAGKDALVIVPRASTHLEYSDIPLVLPASRYGQALSSVYVQAFLDRYLKHHSAEPLLATSWPYLEPRGKGVWKRITLERAPLLSARYCSAYDIATDIATEGDRAENGDIANVGGCD
jgi:dienelactone hydrolase